MPDAYSPAVRPSDPAVYPRTESSRAPANGLSNLGDVISSSGVTTGIPRRPAGLVWIVFYWSLSGVAAMAMGLAATWFAGVMVGAAAAGEGRPGFGVASGHGAIVAALVEFLGLLLFHFGLLILVTCYGLWTFRKWALCLAKVLAVAFVVLILVGFVGSLISRVGIVSNLVNLGISIAVVVYLYGSSNLSERLQQVFSHVGQVDGQTWERYR